MHKCGSDPKNPCQLCFLVATLVSLTPGLQDLLDIGVGEENEAADFASEYESVREVRVAIERRLKANMKDGPLVLDFDFADPLPGLQLLMLPLECKRPWPGIPLAFLPS